MSIDEKFLYSLEVRLLDLEKKVEDLAAHLNSLANRIGKDEATAEVNLTANVLEKIRRGENPVRAIRTYRLFTQKDLSDMCGIRPNHISSIERGTPYGLKTAKRLAEALDVPVQFLL